MAERVFNKIYKEDYMQMQTGEDWNELKKKYGDISKYQWDKEMNEHFDWLIGKYSSLEDYRKK